MGEVQIYNDIIFEIMAYHDITQYFLDHGLSTYYQYLAGDPIIEIHNKDRSDNGFISSGYNGTNYIASDNRGLGSTVATMKLTVRFTGYPITDNVSTASGINLRITYISNGEDNYDYALFSKSGLTEYDFPASVEYNDPNVYKSAYGESSDEEQTLYYYIPNNGDQTDIFINYRKDGSVDYGLDRLYMRIAFETTEDHSGYYLFGLAVQFNGYTYLSGSWGSSRPRDMYHLSVYNHGCYAYITSGWPALDSGIQSGTSTYVGSNGVIYFWSSGYTDSVPTNVKINAGAYGHKSVTTIECPGFISGTTKSSIRTNVQHLTRFNAAPVNLQQVLWKFVMWGGNNVADWGNRWSHVTFKISDGDGNFVSGKTGLYGLSFVFSSAITSDISGKTVTWSRPGGISSSATIEWLPYGEEYVNYWWCSLSIHGYNASTYSTDWRNLAMYSGNGVSVHMNPPKNSGQIATMKFIKEEIGANYTVQSAQTAYRWYDITNNRKYFTFDKSGNYPLSNNNELLCLGYVMSFSGEGSSSRDFYFNGLSGENSYRIWVPNTGCTES
jgi:hypothetical protein